MDLHKNEVGNDEFQTPWHFHLDTPKDVRQKKETIIISGWFVPAAPKPVKLRVLSPVKEILPVTYGKKRPDVLEALFNSGIELDSDDVGFECECTINSEGEYRIEAQIDGKNWNFVHELKIQYDPDETYEDVYNPEYADLYARHQILLNSKQRYFHELEQDKHFSLGKDDPKLVAFYLPQFHTFKENDEWWGKGFTEWSGVTSALPRFVGHEQPKLPADFGFYDLKNDEVMRDQIALARKHGLYGFCFYYYWFSGKRLLERPIDSFLKHKEWDFNFMICWANENWTRRWDGRNQDILIAQQRHPDDPLKFIKDVELILTDPRYIRIDGRPVLLVYRPMDLKEPKKYAQVWRDYFKKAHGTDLLLVSVQGFDFEDPKTLGFDKGLSFVPHSLVKQLDMPILPQYPYQDKQMDNNFTGIVYDYRQIAMKAGKTAWGASNFQTVMPSWDNDARKKGNGIIFQNANPDIYARWLRDVLDSTVDNAPADNMVFLNAWNEWAEGTYLEPDKQYGHAFLNRTSEILATYSKDPRNRKVFPLYDIKRQKNVKLAIVIHMYYASMWPMFKKKFAALPQDKYDLFVTIPRKSVRIEPEIRKFKKNAYVYVVPNHGRDVLPFIHVSRRLKEAGYEYVLKLHTKKSPHRVDGDQWMQDLLDKLVPESTASFKRITEVMDKESTGLIGPAGHFISLASFFGSNKKTVFSALTSILGESQQQDIVNNLGLYGFFAGTMFWARLDAIAPILNKYYQPDDFEIELGQVDGTFAHALERIFSIIPITRGKSMYYLENGRPRMIPQSAFSSKTHYDYALNEVEAIQSYPGLEQQSSTSSLAQPTRVGKVFRLIQKVPRYYATYGPATANQIIRSVIDDRYHGPKLFPMTLPAELAGVKFIATKLDESSASRTIQEIGREFRVQNKGVPVEFHTFTPAYSKSIARLRNSGFRPKVHLDTNITLEFAAGDTIVLNAADLSVRLKKSMIDGLKKNGVHQIIWLIPSAQAVRFKTSNKGVTFKKFELAGKIKVFQISKDGGITDEDGTRMNIQQLVKRIRFKS